MAAYLVPCRARDQNRCSRCGSAGNLEVHHRVRRSQCGSNLPSNLITLCHRCHRWAHDHPYAANREGLLLRHGDDARTISVRHVLWPAAQVWLDDAWGFMLTAPALAPAAA